MENCCSNHSSTVTRNQFWFTSTATPTLLFGPCLLWPKGWMDQDATWHGGRPRPRRHCVRWGPSSPSRQGAQQPPTFRPMSILAKRSPISATVELFFTLFFRFIIYVATKNLHW